VCHTCADTRTHVQTHAHTCPRAHARSPVSLYCGVRGDSYPHRCLGTAWETDRWTDRQAALPRSPGTAWETDGQTDHGVSGRPDGRTAARRPVSSRQNIVCPQAPSRGRRSPKSWHGKTLPEEPAWEAAPRHGSRRAWDPRHSQRAGAAGGSPAGWQCWHPAVSMGFTTHHAPVQLLRGIKAVEFVSTDGGQFSSRHFTPHRAPPFAGSLCGRGRARRAERRRARPAALFRRGFLSPHLGEFSSTQEEGMKSGGKSCRAVPASDASGCGAAAPGLCRQRHRAPSAVPAPSTSQPFARCASQRSAVGQNRVVFSLLDVLPSLRFIYHIM